MTNTTKEKIKALEFAVQHIQEDVQFLKSQFGALYIEFDDYLKKVKK